MGTTLATKQDLLLLKQDLLLLASKQDLLLLKQDVALLRQELENRYVLLDQKIDTLQLRMIVKLGSMLFVSFGLTIAALRLWV